MNLRVWRKSQGMTLQQAAPILGLPVSSLSDLECGKSNFSRETIARIDGATAGKVTATDLNAPFLALNDGKFYDEHRAAGRAAMALYRKTAKKPRK